MRIWIQVVIEVARKRIMKEEKKPCCTNLCAFRCITKCFVLNYLSEKLPLSQNYFTSEGANSHNVLYYQQLSVARYQVSFYANKYFK